MGWTKVKALWSRWGYASARGECAGLGLRDSDPAMNRGEVKSRIEVTVRPEAPGG